MEKVQNKIFGILNFIFQKKGGGQLLERGTSEKEYGKFLASK